MEATQNNDQVAIIQNSIEVLKTGPEILQANQIKRNKAVQVGNNILSAIAESGMDQTLDERAMNYLSNVNAANKTMKEQRAGVTQIMDQLKKMYTEVENELDPKKENTVPAKIQAHRDKYAKQVATEKEEKRKAAELIAAKAKEAIELKSAVEVQYSNFYNDFLLTKKQALQNNFNAITLGEFADKADKLKAYRPVLNVELLQAFKAKIYSSIHTAPELFSFTKEVCDSKTEEFRHNYTAELTLLRDDLIEKLPSKLSELQEQKRLADEAAAEKERQRIAKEKSDARIASANAEQKKRLEAEAETARIANEKRNAELKAQLEKSSAEQKQREEAEAQRISAENEENKRRADQEVEVKKQGEKTMVLFEQEAGTADLSNGPEARQGYEIIVLHPVGYTQIFALYFEHEGKNLPVDKLGNTKLDQMKAWCEKKALKDGTKIESKFLKYEDSFKAVNRKSVK
jgi:hypothetical protein